MSGESKANEARKMQIQRETAAAGARVQDRFGKILQVGGQVELHISLPVVFQVTDMVPILDVNAPAGMWRIQLETVFMLQGMNDQRLNSLTVIRSPEVSQPVDLNKPNGQEDHSAPEPPESPAVDNAADVRERDTSPLPFRSKETSDGTDNEK